MQEKIKLVSTAGTGHYYTTTKNKRTHPEKMEMKILDLLCLTLNIRIEAKQTMIAK